MFENDDDILLQEILSCQNNDDIQNLVYSQCLDIIGNSLQDQIALSHKQLFRVIRLFKEYISQKPFQFQEQRKSIQQAHALQKQNCIIAIQLLKENDTMKLQLKVYEGDLDILKSQNFEDIKKLEQQLVKTLQQISLYKESLIQKLCVVCMKNDYTMIIKPCGHVCVCEECSKQIDQCPIDREKVTKIKKVYLP